MKKKKQLQELTIREDDIIGIMPENQTDRYAEAIKKIQPATYTQIANEMHVQHTSSFRHRLWNRVRDGRLKAEHRMVIFKRGGSQLSYLFMMPDFDFKKWEQEHAMTSLK